MRTKTSLAKRFEEEGKETETETGFCRHKPGIEDQRSCRKRHSRSEHAPTEADALSPACAKELSAASDAPRVRGHWSGALCRCNVPGVVFPGAREDFVRQRGEVEVEAIVHLAVLLASLAAVR